MKKIYILLVSLFCLGIGTAKAQYKVLLNFGEYANPVGSYPAGSLTLSGSKLYGMTYAGGKYNTGVVFSIDSNGSNYKDLHDMDSTGGWTEGSLLLIGSKLYGVNSTGGPGYWGYIFSIDTNGTGFKDIFNFTDKGNIGGLPAGDLAYSNGRLYGTSSGGADTSTMMTIFSIDTNGKGYKLVFGGDYYYINPGLTYVDGKLYGTAGGGAGFIFSTDTNGNRLKNLYTFDSATGEYPYGELVYASGTLYGMTSAGGKGYGTIYSVDTDGTGHTDLFNFTGTDGGDPYGNSLTFSITGDTLFGMTSGGGTEQSGTIFSINKNGSGYAVMHDFSNGPGGIYPSASLTLSGNTLYGTAYLGGLSNYGVIFSCKTSSCTNTFDEPICIVTLDTATNKNMVIWGRTNSPPDLAHNSYNIYRDTGSHGDTNAGYQLLNNQPLDSLSEYIDTTSTISGPVSYQLSTVDSCGESALSAPHTTIFLTTTPALNAYHLSWTAYGGFTPTKYLIFRGLRLNALAPIDSVASNVLTYSDTLPPIGSIYAIEAVSPNGVCIPTTHRPNSRFAMLSGSFSNGFSTATLGIPNMNASVSKLNIYPNPSNGNFTLTYSLNNSGNVRTTLINELGQIVYDNTEQKSGGTITEQLNLENLATGIYSLRLQTDNSIMVRKLVVMGN